MSPGTISPLSTVRALTFDVFGTLFDWRSTVTSELILRAHRKLNAPSSSNNLTPPTRQRLQSISEEDWGRFAQQWRNSYGVFTKGFNPEADAWKTVDQHHLESLVDLLKEWELEGLYSEGEVESLSLVWHRLTPWEDTARGLQKLKALGLKLSTLSNGNTALLKDLVDFSNEDMPFDMLLSAEDFGVYKPHPGTYRGAVRKLLVGGEGAAEEDVDGKMGEAAMVAAHLGDLEKARAQGMRTVYVAREGEEDEGKWEGAREWVDVWVEAGEGGIERVARELERLR